jgi:hypothetical protein
VAYWYFLYTPVPEVPRLGSSVEYDSIRVGGLVRSYAFYAPANLVAGAPLVLALHGSIGERRANAACHRVRLRAAGRPARVRRGIPPGIGPSLERLPEGGIVRRQAAGERRRGLSAPG